MYSIKPWDRRKRGRHPSSRSKTTKVVHYNSAALIETFDFPIVEERHRSIYNLWKEVLDYFDAVLIVPTAKPD
jgi:type I restriction enzyme R subunit